MNIELNCIQISKELSVYLTDLNYEYQQDLIDKQEFIHKATESFCEFINFTDIKLLNIVHILSE